MDSTNASSSTNASTTLDTLEALKKVLEVKGMKATEALLRSTNSFDKSVGDKLVAIMQNGSEEFKKNTGREMTYGEMREMYG